MAFVLATLKILEVKRLNWFMVISGDKVPHLQNQELYKQGSVPF